MTVTITEMQLAFWSFITTIYINDVNSHIPELSIHFVYAEFDTSRLEMGAVADLFDRNGSGLIDWEEFIAALRPDWVSND